MENKERTALIIGSHGQMGSYMMDLLKSKGYSVHGISKAIPKKELFESIQLLEPEEIYNFAGYTNTFSPYFDFDKLVEANLILPKDILESIHCINLRNTKKIKFFQASSCLIFGKDTSGRQDEHTPINPSHPYGIIKNAAQQLIKMYREEKGLFACSGIFFPSESPRRGSNFFTKKICSAVARIKMGGKEKIKITYTTRMRDWTYCPDSVEAAWLMLQHHTAKDFVIGNGQIYSINAFIESAFNHVGLDWREHTELDETILRENDLNVLRADTSAIRKELGWEPKHDINFIIRSMVDYEIEQLKEHEKTI